MNDRPFFPSPSKRVYIHHKTAASQTVPPHLSYSSSATALHLHKDLCLPLLVTWTAHTCVWALFLPVLSLLWALSLPSPCPCTQHHDLHFFTTPLFKAHFTRLAKLLENKKKNQKRKSHNTSMDMHCYILLKKILPNSVHCKI